MRASDDVKTVDDLSDEERAALRERVRHYKAIGLMGSRKLPPVTVRTFRLPQELTEGAKARQHLTRYLMAKASHILGSKTVAEAWLAREQPALQGRIPLEVARTADGVEEVIRALHWSTPT